MRAQEPPPCGVEAACVLVGPICPRLPGKQPSPCNTQRFPRSPVSCNSSDGVTPATDLHLPAKVLCVHTAQTPAPGHPRN